MRFDLKVVIGFLITLSLVIVLGVYTYNNSNSQLETSRWVSHTNEVLYRSEQLLSTLTDIETGQRGYCLTNNEDFLKPYTRGKDNIAPQLLYLKKLTKGNLPQFSRIIALEQLIQDKLEFCAEVVNIHQTDPAKSVALVTSLKGKKLMDDIRLSFAGLMTAEKTLLEQRSVENEKQIAKSNQVFALMLAVTILILLILFYTIYINLRARKRTEEALAAVSKDIQDLYDNAPCGYHSLDENGIFLQVNQTMAKWLGYTKEELIGKQKIYDRITTDGVEIIKERFPLFKQQGFIHNLQFDLVRKNGTTFPVIVNSSAITDDKGNYIKSRTTTFDYTEQKLSNDKINTLNQELEAFTYTVSHDLRSPLRSISGYAQILEEDYSPVLNEEGKRVTGVIIKSSKRMGQLIDDLLSFSQIGRKELSSNYIDMDSLLQQLMNDFSKQGDQRPMEINMQQLLSCQGDINMIRQVWFNLLSNAIKYSQKKDNVYIEVGSYNAGPEICYYVKDNGAGFEMQYVHKLFGVFQRLHRINEFEGTGVGLAIVKRIVTRHGGRVWAEGKPDTGATFYFSIPTS